MKVNYILYIILFSFIFNVTSCEDVFLQKPETSGNVNQEEVYSSTKNAESALFNVYRESLIHGWPGGWGGGETGALGSISGERARGYNWHVSYAIAEGGLVTTERGGTNAGADNYFTNWEVIRKGFLVKENIENVPDMTDQMKDHIKAECTALIAYRYMGMFYRYGGLPIVTKAYLPDDDLNFPRTSLQETLDYILELCDEAIEGLPDSWPSNHYGRFTKGAAMAIKARTLMFAARPLFNSSTSPLDFGENKNLICFGNEDKSRWNEAIKANEAVLNWANSNGYEIINTGGKGLGEPNPNALDDYGTATSVPSNREVLLAYKTNETLNAIVWFYNTSSYPSDMVWQTALVGQLSNFMELYYLKDGGDPDWPKVGDPEPHLASHYINTVENMESRFRLDYVLPGFGSLNNPGYPGWTFGLGYPRQVGNYSWDYNFPNANNSGHGNGMPAKFYYKAGSRTWFEPPLFRMAETYLNLAEAYNEIGNTAKALEYLNVVHNRAGLPSISATNEANLRNIIWREKAIEFVGENHRYFDVKHWKHPDIGNGIIGGQYRELQFQINGPNNLKESLMRYWDANTYIGFWHPKMYLEPFPQTEVNKGIIVQNPGY